MTRRTPDFVSAPEPGGGPMAGNVAGTAVNRP
jgi:hypothetical protein